MLGEPRTVRELGSAVDARLEVQARRPDQGELFHFYGGVVESFIQGRAVKSFGDRFLTFSGDCGSPRGRARRKIPTLLFAGLMVCVNTHTFRCHGTGEKNP